MENMYNEYKEMLMNDMDMEGIDLDSLDEFVKNSIDEMDFNANMEPEEILQNTGLNAMKAAGLIAAGLVVTHVTCKYVVPFAMKKVKEFKAKREQAKFEKEMSLLNEHNED